MIHRKSGTPIRYVKDAEIEKGLEEVPEEEIAKGALPRHDFRLWHLADINFGAGHVPFRG
jgi:hypothetical protein